MPKFGGYRPIIKRRTTLVGSHREKTRAAGLFKDSNGNYILTMARDAPRRTNRVERSALFGSFVLRRTHRGRAIGSQIALSGATARAIYFALDAAFTDGEL